MPNLIDDMGAEYITQMYTGAMFLHNDTPHILHRARGGVVLCHQAVGPEWQMVNLTYDDFPDMAKFSWPALGYRNVLFKKHNLVIDIGLQRSAKRGLRDSLITASTTKAAELFYPRKASLLLGEGPSLASIVLKPEYFTMAKAKEMLHKGSAVGCAISSNLALEINPYTEAQGELSVLYRGAKIGSMREDGTLAVPARLAERIAL